MKSPRFILAFIILITVLSIVVDLPQNVPLKFAVGPWKVDRIITPPQISFFGFQKEIKTHLGLDLLGGTQLIVEAEISQLPQADRQKALESVKEIIERRVNFFGVSEPNVQTSQSGDNYRVIVEIPGINNLGEAVSTLGQTAQLDFRELSTESTQSALYATLENTESIGVTGKNLKKAEVSFDPNTGEPTVSFEFDEEGAKNFGEATTRLTGESLAIFLDEFPVSIPTVRTPITDGRGVISGNFTREDAKRLSLQLSAGALPVPIHIVGQRNVGATLGQISVVKSVRAGVIGLSLVAIFMALYYGKLGIIADIALVIYGLITFALFRLIPVTLTLPGIAGFLLSIGMAVDSNILIFERMKEEMRKGKPVQLAMELGFGRAWDAIRDANFTTLLTAFILYNPLNWNFFPVSGMVRGFALTLGLGVLISMFTGIVVSRNLVRIFYRPKEGRTS